MEPTSTKQWGKSVLVKETTMAFDRVSSWQTSTDNEQYVLDTGQEKNGSRKLGSDSHLIGIHRYMTL